MTTATGALTISDLSKAVGLSPKTIRFYEDKGLVPLPKRSEGGYRLYEPADVQRLTFIRRARALGFSLTEVRRLVRLAEHDSCASFQGTLAKDVLRKLGETDQLIEELTCKRQELTTLASCLTDEPCTDCQECGDCQQTALDCYVDVCCLGA